MMRGDRKGYWGTGGESFGGGGVGENLGGDTTGSSGMCEILGSFEESVVIDVPLDFQCLNSLLNVGCVVLEKAVPPYVSIQSLVFQLCEGSVDDQAVVRCWVEDIDGIISKGGDSVEVGHGVWTCS